MTHLLNLLAAIALLVWGTHIVRTGMLRVFGENLRRVLAKSFGSRPAALLAGLGVTSLVQSSTATCLIVASFVGKGLVPTGAALQELIETTFPNAQSRSYPIDATQMFATIEDLVEERGWEVRTRRAPPTALDAGQLNAISVSLFGFRDEVAIRVAGSPAGSTVDMRSVALSGFHDFGENGRRVEELLLALDAQITLLLRNAPQAPAADLEIGENDDPGEAGEAVAAE